MSESPALPVLYSFRRCPYAMRARLALAASGRQCELREVVLRDKPQALIQASPKGTVPVLVLPDGVVLEQSLDIMLWALRLRDPQDWLAPDDGDLASMLDLIADCDDRFKRHLDRYKYPGRFKEEFMQEHGAVDAASALSEWAVLHRGHGGAWLATLEARLENNAWLFGSRPALADMAIAPFVRQYAHVDKDWFQAQPWSRLQAWLSGWMESALFVSIMIKYRPWAPDESGEAFPFIPSPESQ